METPKIIFLDTSQYSEGPDHFPPEFECIVCTGCVLNPVECSECQSLYCKSCVAGGDLPCPKRCVDAKYNKLNRIVQGHLSKLRFKCEKHGKCGVVVPYGEYEKHIQTCEHMKPNDEC